ncbi:hypothetical protein Tco_1476382 [Tanacetum coccineum]
MSFHNFSNKLWSKDIQGVIWFGTIDTKKEKNELKKSKRLKLDIGRFLFAMIDDDEESSIPLKDIIISGLPPCVAITSALSTEKSVDSLIMEDEHLDTIPETESDEFIKSNEVSPIDDEVLESITSIPPGIDSFDAESDLIESLLNRDTSINDSQKIDSLLDEFASELTLLKSIPPGIDDDNLDNRERREIHLLRDLLYSNSSPPLRND